MAKREPLGERIARIEEQCKVIFDKLGTYNDLIHDFQDDLKDLRTEFQKDLTSVRASVEDMQNMLESLQKDFKNKLFSQLSGKMKASIYIALILSVSQVVVELIKSGIP